MFECKATGKNPVVECFHGLKGRVRSEEPSNPPFPLRWKVKKDKIRKGRPL